MITQFLICLIPVCLSIWAINVLFQEGHLFEKQGEWMESHWPEKVNKPLWMCPICQSSVWGILGFIAIRFFFSIDLPYKQILPFVFCLCGLNTIISKLTTKERIIVEE